MIVEIKKNINDLKIGLLGTRSSCFAAVLDEKNIQYTHLKCDQINSTYDFVFESGVYEILPQRILNKPRYGVIGIHESPLPEGRGHAPIQWAVLNNRKNLTITLYKLNECVDAGSIIVQHNVPILHHDTLEDLDAKRRSGISDCFRVFLEELESGYLVLREQTGSKSYFKKRTTDSCELDVEMKLKDLWNFIRICDNDLYPAWFKVGDKKIFLKYSVEK